MLVNPVTEDVSNIMPTLDEDTPGATPSMYTMPTMMVIEIREKSLTTPIGFR